MSTLNEFLVKSKHSLTRYINDLSSQIQKNYAQTTNTTSAGANIVLSIENEALEHIEYLVLNLFYLILTNSTQQQQTSPSSQQQSPTLLQTQSLLSTSSTSLTSTISIASSASVASQNTVLINQHELNSLIDVESRIRRLLPKNLADTAIQRANTILNKYQSLPKRLKDHLIRSTNASASTSIIQAGLSSLQSLATFTTNAPLPQSDNLLLIYPLDKLHKLIKSMFNVKLEKHILVYLVAILEFLTKDILRLACGYVRNLNKLSITKRDVCISIYADHMLAELFCPQSTSSTSAIETEDDLLMNNQLLNSLLDETTNESNSCSCLNLDRISFNSISSGDSDKTICNECQLNTNKRLNLYNQIYSIKIKEFQFELNQHINDLNLLRKLFRNYLLKCINRHCAATHDSTAKLIDGIFGNLNDLYECSLRLLDSLDDLIQSADEQMFKLNEQTNLKATTTTLIMPQLQVGQAFWELAEGAEFDVYEKYAKIQFENNFSYDNINRLLQILQSQDDLYKYLTDKMLFNINDTYKYLLPKLLMSPIYYILYLYDTIDYLITLTQCDEDKDLLKQTLDTLLHLKYYLNDKFSNSKLIQTFYNQTQMRPIESSIRILQYNYTNFDTYLNLIQDYPNLKELFKKTYIYKLNSQTEHKWCEIRNRLLNNDASLQLASSLHADSQNSFKQILFKRLNPYLFETSILICKSNQHLSSMVQNKSIKDHLTSMSNNTKFKLNERYIYLFDGLLMIFKQVASNTGASSTLSGDANIKLKLKHEISLAKCILIDRKDDDLCFELQVFSNSNQDCEYLLFICKTQVEKLHLMSLFCYIQYKLQLDRMLQNVIESLNNQSPLPIPPRNYLFNQPDVSDNIIFDQNDATTANLLIPGAQTSTATQSTDGPIIKAATIEKLIERLTHHLYLYPKFSRTFLVCYREFCSPLSLLDLLIKRFYVPDLRVDDIECNDDKNSDDECVLALKIELIKRYKREYQQPIKLKVINVIKHWLDGYYNDDFKTNRPLLERLNEFIDELGETNKRYQQVLTKSIEKKDSTASSDDHIEDPGALSLYPAFELHLEELHGYDILTIHPLEFARQATLMESELYRAIKPNELITLGWTKANKSELAPNVTRLVNLSNKFTYWYSKLIVDTLNLDERCAVMQRILDIANYFYELNNFSGLREIYAALEITCVHRLEVTRERCDIENQAIYEKFRALFDKNHGNAYLERLKKCNPPCLPFIGIHQSNITKIYEYNKLNADKQKQQIQQLQQQQQQSTSTSSLVSSSPSGSMSTLASSETPPPSPSLTSTGGGTTQLINFAKYRLLVDFVNDLLQYQNTVYKLRVNKRIRTFINEDIDNYYQKATAIVDAGDPLDALDSTKHDESQLIRDWLDAKSKLIEPESFKYTPYPQLRKYNLKSPAPKYLKQNSKQINRQQQQQQQQQQSPLPPSSNKRVQSPQQSINSKKSASHKKKFAALDASITSINTSSSSSVPESSSSVTTTPLSTPKLDKSSLSSADSSATNSPPPNSPPPNYDDVFQLTIPYQQSPTLVFRDTHNCFDNKTYFMRLNEQQRRSTSSIISTSEQQQQQAPYRKNSSSSSAVFKKFQNTIFFPNDQITEQPHHHHHHHHHRTNSSSGQTQPRSYQRFNSQQPNSPNIILQPPHAPPPPPPPAPPTASLYSTLPQRPPPPPPPPVDAPLSSSSSSSSSIGTQSSPPPLPARQNRQNPYLR